jgi:nicotinate phosphoribosyltransferase
VRASIDVIAELDLRGAVGIRLDSGDLAELAVTARAMLDAAGLRRAQIIASGGLDEHQIATLVARGAPIDAYGVGTRMGVSADAPSLDSAYKLVAYGDRPVMKLSAGKATLPGAKQVFRAPTGDEGDVLGLRDEEAGPAHAPLLIPVIRDGRPTPQAPDATDLSAARRRFTGDLEWLPSAARDIDDPTPVQPSLSAPLAALRRELAAALTANA